MTTEFDTMGKEALRSACRAAGISYGKLGTNAAMAEALKKFHSQGAEKFVRTTATEDTRTAETERREPPLTNNPFAALVGAVKVPEFKGASILSSDGKIVQPGDVQHEDEEKPAKRVKRQVEATPAPVLERVSCKGRKIQKEREVKNNVKRPSTGTRCSEIWDFLDANPKTLAHELNGIADSHLWDRTTMHVQFYAWRRFNGISKKA